MMKRAWIYIVVFMAVVNYQLAAIAGHVTTNSGATVSLPYSQDFDGGTWDNNGYLTSDECGGTARRSSTGCYSGDCLKVIPPTSDCTGDNLNGGAVGMGWFGYSGSTELHWRFLIKFGSYYAPGQTNGGGGLINKFLLSDGPSRVSILGFNCSDTSGRYCAFGILDSIESYRFRTMPHRAWIEDAEFRVSSTANVDEWIAVEYALNTSTGIGKLYLWTQDQEFNGILIDNVTIPTGTSMTSFYFSYFNSYGAANANNYYLIDNLVISNSYVGPPADFFDEADTTAPTVTAFTIPSTSTSLTVSITEFTATDTVGVTGYCVNESATAPTAGSCSGSGWASSRQESYIFSTAGSKTLYAWAKDAAGNISTSLNDGVTITLPPATVPIGAVTGAMIINSN